MLEKFVKHYIDEYAPKLSNHIAFYADLSDQKMLIHHIAFAIDENHRTHSHQRRIPIDAKKNLKDYLCKNIASIQKAGDFDRTFHKLLKIPGIGELTAYDTAVRLGLLPKKIYLHTGSLQGAHSLFSALQQPEKLHDSHVLDTADFPQALQILTPLHVEHFLCIYKLQLQFCSE